MAILDQPGITMHMLRGIYLWQRSVGRRETSDSRLSLARRASQNLLRAAERLGTQYRLQQQSFPNGHLSAVSEVTTQLLSIASSTAKAHGETAGSVCSPDKLVRPTIAGP